jgi:thioredoxin reductase
MPLPDRHSLAIIGAGPIGLEAALAALDRGLEVHVFERGDVGAHTIAWGHVRMFTPWRMNLGPVSVAHLERAGWTRPDAEAFPTGLELAEQYLAPIAALPELAGRIHARAQVVEASRRGVLKNDLKGRPERREKPFRVLVRDQGGRENYIHAFALIDASGVYGNPNRAGDGGIPARQELYLAPQLSYHPDDVLGARRARYAGKTVLVVGAGSSAATTVTALAKLAGEVDGTRAIWVTRAAADRVMREVPGDPLPGRRALHAEARALVGGSHPAVTHVGNAVIEGFEFNSATHRYRVNLRIDEAARIEEADHVIVNTGYRPDRTLHRELQVEECFASEAPAGVAAALPAPGGDCLATPTLTADALASREPDFYLLGHKAYGRRSDFLLEAGYRQVAEVIERLAGSRVGV